MQELLSYLKEIIFSVAFPIFIFFSSAAFASRRIYRTTIAKQGLELTGEGWEAFYYVHLFINFLVVVGSYLGIIYHYNFTTFIAILIATLSISGIIQKEISRIVLTPRQADPVKRIGMYYKVVPVVNLVLIALYLVLLYIKYLKK